MSDTMTISTAAAASISSGVLFCNFSDMHEAAEFLMGHPIWTHHFASKELSENMRETLLAQYPDLPTKADCEGITRDNWREKLAEIEAKHGRTITIRKGGGLTAMLPTDGIPDHLKDHTVFVKAK